MEYIQTFLGQQPMMALFLTIAIGYLLGEVNIKGFSLGVGMLGYAEFEHLPWLDAFLNAAMLLGGMGPVDLPQTDYRAALLAAGLPDALAAMLADSSAKAASGGLFDDSRTLSRLIGRPTTPVRETIAAALQTASA